MSQLLIAISTTLHALAMIIFIGHYLLMSLLYLPALSKMDKEGALALGEMSQRSRSWMYISILVFLVTGIHLMLVDPNYRGIGNFSNPWAILMLVKHLLILVMIALGFWFNALQRVGPTMRSNTRAAQGVNNFRRYSTAMAVSGVAVLLLTALAQVQ